MLYSFEYMCYIWYYIGCYIAPLVCNPGLIHHCKNCLIAADVIRGVLYSIKCYIASYIEALYSTSACYIAFEYSMGCLWQYIGCYTAPQFFNHRLIHHWRPWIFGCSYLPLARPSDASGSLQPSCERRRWLHFAAKLQVKSANRVNIYYTT